MVWITLIDTSCELARSPATAHDAMTAYPLQPRSMVVLVERQRDQVRQDRRNEQ
jgi:hypothetical protein